jgi:hypothetical protein
MKDGHLNFCKECVKWRVADHRQQRIDLIRAYDRERAKLPHRRQHLGAVRALYLSDPLKRVCKNAVSNAIRDGKLARPSSCSKCGASCKPEAHHDDYTKPLDVRWLCVPCHRRHHTELAVKRKESHQPTPAMRHYG